MNGNDVVEFMERNFDVLAERFCQGHQDEWDDWLQMHEPESIDQFLDVHDDEWSRFVIEEMRSGEE